MNVPEELKGKLLNPFQEELKLLRSKLDNENLVNPDGTKDGSKYILLLLNHYKKEKELDNFYSQPFYYDTMCEIIEERYRKGLIFNDDGTFEHSNFGSVGIIPNTFNDFVILCQLTGKELKVKS
jgi:hypothetical protein